MERLLKAESPHFVKKYFSKNFLNFLCLFGTKTVNRLLCAKWSAQMLDTVWDTKRHQNMKIKLEIESIDPKLSKSGLRMFLRCLVRNLYSEVDG